MMNPATIIVLLVVAALLGLAVWSMLRRRRKGGGSVCGSCPYSDSCASVGQSGGSCDKP